MLYNHRVFSPLSSSPTILRFFTNFAHTPLSSRLSSSFYLHAISTARSRLRIWHRGTECLDWKEFLLYLCIQSQAVVTYYFKIKFTRIWMVLFHNPSDDVCVFIVCICFHIRSSFLQSQIEEGTRSFYARNVASYFFISVPSKEVWSIESVCVMPLSGDNAPHMY